MIDRIKKINPMVVAFVLLILVVIVLVLADSRQQTADERATQAESQQRLIDDLLIAGTEFPDEWIGKSRVDSLMYAEEQDSIRVEEARTLYFTTWPRDSVFTNREDSLRFALAQDDEHREKVEAGRREVKRRASFTWSTTSFVNEWGERTSSGAQSEQVRPVEPMGFPYSDVEAEILVRCGGGTWIRFTDSPNLTGGITESGHDIYHLSIRLDRQQTRWRVTQYWGDKDLNLPNSARRALMNAKTFEIVLPWYGEGYVRFKWDLTGSSDIISEACG